MIIPFLRQHKIQIIHSHTEFFIAHAAKLPGTPSAIIPNALDSGSFIRKPATEAARA